MSPEMLEVNRAPELKSVAVDLLNYLVQVHINKSNFSLSDYKFDGLIANEIFAMAKTDEVFSALFSFLLDETLPLKKHYQDLLEKAKKECLIDIAQLTETMDETYIFTHYFLGSIHDKLSLWIRRYETYEKYKKENPIIDKYSHIEEYLEQYLDQEWREQLSGYRENRRALSHYYKSFEMRNEGRAYHNMIDTMCYLKDDYNDRSDHFNIAEERHLIVNGKAKDKINAIKDLYKESKLDKVENYFR